MKFSAMRVAVPVIVFLALFSSFAWGLQRGRREGERLYYANLHYALLPIADVSHYPGYSNTDRQREAAACIDVLKRQRADPALAAAAALADKTSKRALDAAAILEHPDNFPASLKTPSFE